MKTIGQSLSSYRVIGVKPGFNLPEENNVSAFKVITESSFPGKWKIFYFYPKDFTFVCPTEISEYNKLVKDFNERNAILLGGSSDNEFVKLAWRRENSNLYKLNHWQFSDTNGSLIDQLGIRHETGVALRATFIFDPQNIIQHITVNNLNVGRNPIETLRILDAIQTGKLCACNRTLNGKTL
ncbi:peroxiredoxin [Candidatus Profftella armatura]|uniref:Alkyl hydroperoxide reductase C n=1 Tax=Candidatus Profftella armatura TaxID=669502 RepID=S5RLW2_9PROT|nr:peroxiredoxin [Candidatus Profftella armatura]AGS06921.1 alkyl hydroperoxide reductase [Candidatus Profftella armatura]ALC96000.1 alkyl hydroperoxide reductase [Candidatus Profftella armatura]QLK13829.1 peroxiredoxin [Candidatus Profftella armatura]